MRISLRVLFLLLLALLLLCGCGEREYTYEIFAMNTVIGLRFTANSQQEADNLARECEVLISEIEQQTSRTLETSDVALFNAASDSILLGVHSHAILERALEISALSDGAYDLTVAPLVALWNVTAENPRIPDADEIAAALAHVGYEKLTLYGGTLTKSDPACAIDLGSIAKGYALGKTAELLSEAGVKGAVISFGGNVAAVGKKADGSLWKIGIKNPVAPTEAAGYLHIEDGCVSVSGDYERYFELDGRRYHHIISPSDGYPASGGIHSVAILCDDAMTGDALSTAIFVGGIELCEKLYTAESYRFEALIYTDDGVYMTEGMTEYYEEKKHE